MKLIREHIRKIGGKYRLLSHKGKNLGTYGSRAGAEKREREVEYFKHHERELKKFSDMVKRGTKKFTRGDAELDAHERARKHARAIDAIDGMKREDVNELSQETLANYVTAGDHDAGEIVSGGWRSGFRRRHRPTPRQEKRIRGASVAMRKLMRKALTNENKK